MLQPHDRILFIGDSVTNAFRMPQEVSSAYQLGAGYTLLVAAHYQLGRPADGLQFFNRGISGNGVKDLENRWQDDCLALEPTVVSILIGVNETICSFKGYSHLNDDQYEDCLNALVTSTKAALLGVRLVLCEPFLTPTGSVTSEWVADIAGRGAAVRRVAAAHGAVCVPLQQPFAEACALAPPEYWAFDGIHPTAAGFGIIARQWIQAVG